ncbi:MAG: DUF1311 domain-containing protein [Proteobacteria bacterium]|nr:DUF1311 domain-containing protein [Pseudomonadota bacterium]
MNFKTYLRSIFYFIIVCPNVFATADGPDFFKNKDDVLEIKVFELPEVTSKHLESLKAPILGLRNLGCKGSVSFKDWQNLNEEQKSKVKNDIWCKIAYHEIEGWVQNKDLTEDNKSKLPTYNCAKVKSEIETLICNYQELIDLDYFLTKVYEQALTKASKIDDHPKQAVQELKATQRGWVKGRNDCWKEMGAKYQCVKSNYEQRIAYLQVKWALIPSESVNRYFCQSNRGEFTVSLFLTQPIKGAAVEYGDKTKIFLQIDNKDRSRFDGEFGSYFELRDKEGIFLWEQSTEPLKCILQK